MDDGENRFPVHDMSKSAPVLCSHRKISRDDHPIDDLAKRVEKLVCACGQDPAAVDWKRVHARLVEELEAIHRARQRSNNRMLPWSDVAQAVAPAEWPPIQHEGGAIGPTKPQSERREALGLALNMADVGWQGRPPKDARRRVLREAILLFQANRLGRIDGYITEESRARDEYVEREAAKHGREKPNRDEFRILLQNLIDNGQLTNRYPDPEHNERVIRGLNVVKKPYEFQNRDDGRSERLLSIHSLSAQKAVTSLMKGYLARKRKALPSIKSPEYFVRKSRLLRRLEDAAKLIALRARGGGVRI